MLAEPICAVDWNNLTFVVFWLGSSGMTGSTKYVLPVSKPINPSPSGWYVTASPWINLTFLESGKFIKLYLSLKGLNPSKPAAVPPVNVSSMMLVFIS